MSVVYKFPGSVVYKSTIQDLHNIPGLFTFAQPVRLFFGSENSCKRFNTFWIIDSEYKTSYFEALFLRSFGDHLTPLPVLMVRVLSHK